jgi:hypothetical protein
MRQAPVETPPPAPPKKEAKGKPDKTDEKK